MDPTPMALGAEKHMRDNISYLKVTLTKVKVL